MENDFKYESYVILSVLQVLVSFVMIAVLTWLKLSEKLPHIASEIPIVMIKTIFIVISMIPIFLLVLFKQKLLAFFFKDKFDFGIYSIGLSSVGIFPVILGSVLLMLGGSFQDSGLLFFAGIALYYLSFISPTRWKELIEQQKQS